MRRIAGIIILLAILFLFPLQKSYAASITVSINPSKILPTGTTTVQFIFQGVPFGTRVGVGPDNAGVAFGMVPEFVYDSCSNLPKPNQYWSNWTCSGTGGESGTETISGVWSAKADLESNGIYDVNTIYAFYHSLNSKISGGTLSFEGAVTPSFSIKSVSPALAKQGDSVSIVLENAVSGKKYSVFVVDRSFGDTICNSSTCALNSWTVPIVTSQDMAVYVVNYDTNPVSKLKVPISFELGFVGDNLCVTCAIGSTWNSTTKKCNDAYGTITVPTLQATCSTKETCFQGQGCKLTQQAINYDSVEAPCDNCVSYIVTAFGKIPTTPEGISRWLFGFILSLSGGILTILLILSGYRLVTSQGDPEKIKEARERITSAVIGLLFIIFSFVFYEFITTNVLRLPGFGG